MGAWNHTLLGNDSVQDALMGFESTIPLVEQQQSLRFLRTAAEKESEGMWIPGDELMDVPETFQEGQETNARTTYLGVVQHFLEQPKGSDFLTRADLEFSLKVVQQLSHQGFVNAWRDPIARFQELFKFKEQLEQVITKVN